MSKIQPLIVGQYSLLEQAALNQIYATIKRFPGICELVSMPDLHPGVGVPIGCAIKSRDVCYPTLIGGDIGCGMTLFNVENSHAGKFKLKKALKKVEDVRLRDYPTPRDLLSRYGLPECAFDSDIGTIGGGNHFAELLEVEEVKMEEEFAGLGLKQEALLMLVHSGSRTLGQDVASNEILSDSVAISEYLARHDHAVKWAKVNRILIAQRLARVLNYRLDMVLDIVHNYLQPVGKSEVEGDESDYYIHRKGVGYVKMGECSIIPGSRGTFSYIVKMTQDEALAERHLNCIAHGAGRRWNRSTAEAHMKAKHKNSRDLLTTSMGSGVVCHSKSLLYQEAPEAYKNVDDVVEDLKEAGLISVVAVLRPLLTYKA